MKKEIAASVLDEEEPTRSLEISSAADLDKKKSSLGAFLTRVKIFLLKRKKYDVQTLVWIRYLPFYLHFIKNNVQYGYVSHIFEGTKCNKLLVK